MCLAVVCVEDGLSQIQSQLLVDLVLRKITIANTVYMHMVYLAVALIWWFGESHKYCQIKCTPLILGCKLGFLSIQYLIKTTNYKSRQLHF